MDCTSADSGSQGKLVLSQAKLFAGAADAFTDRNSLDFCDFQLVMHNRAF